MGATSASSSSLVLISAANEALSRSSASSRSDSNASSRVRWESTAFSYAASRSANRERHTSSFGVASWQPAAARAQDRLASGVLAQLRERELAPLSKASP